MSYIRHEHRHLLDPRWLDASPAAFAVHTWALDFCNEGRTNGTIPAKAAHRLSCPVEPADVPAAFNELVELGFWTHDDEGYRCPDFLAHGLDAEAQNEMQNRWATDKRRRGLHNNGVHTLCTPRSCPAARAQVESAPEQSEPAPHESGHLSQAKPSQAKPLKGLGAGVGDGSLGGSAPEGATPPASAGRPDQRPSSHTPGWVEYSFHVGGRAASFARHLEDYFATDIALEGCRVINRESNVGVEAPAGDDGVWQALLREAVEAFRG